MRRQCIWLSSLNPNHFARAIFRNQRYNYLFRVKTSVTLRDDLLRQIDRTQPNRSSFIEKAARKFLEDEARAKRRMKDAAILERPSKIEELNQALAEALE